MRRCGAVAAVALAVVVAAPSGASAAPVSVGRDRIVLQTNAGDVVLGLFPQAAPRTVAHVIDLARSGALDGAEFFRVVPGFVAQVDALQRATPLSVAARAVASQTVPLEVSPGLRHQRGMLSMAHYDGKPNSGGRSFSVVLGDAPSLDGKYTVFGDVERGMDVIDGIASVPLAGSQPVVPIVISHAVVTDVAGLSALTLRGPIAVGGASGGPLSSWPRLLLSTSMGDIVVTLSPRDAPRHVKLVESLVEAGSYNGAYVGRASPNSYVQWFAARPGTTTSPLPLERGTVGNVAGALAIDSTDSEQVPALTFVLSDNHGLDARYTAVGWVTDGTDVLDALGRLPTGRDQRPHDAVYLQKATILPAGANTVIVHGLPPGGGSSSGTPWGVLGFLVAAGVLGLVVFLFSKRLTPPFTASAGLLVVAVAFVGLWVGLAPRAAASSQWLGIALFGGAVGLFRLMGRFERGRPIAPPAPTDRPTEPAVAAGTAPPGAGSRPAAVAGVNVAPAGVPAADVPGAEVPAASPPRQAVTAP